MVTFHRPIVDDRQQGFDVLAVMRRRWHAVTVPLVVATMTVACGERPALVRLSEARHLSAELLVSFTKAGDASNRAVMADTDEASAAFAREAREASEKVQRQVDELEKLLSSLNYASEGDLLRAFGERFGSYRELDERVLGLAVENTNLKAQRLSFGPVRETADALRDALASVGPADAAQTWHVKALAGSVMSAVREIQALQAPHIAEADEAAMMRLEGTMHDAQTQARSALRELSALARRNDAPLVADATKALDRLEALNAEVLELSRRNTNVRSVALALNEKGKLTAVCEEELRKLNDALTDRMSFGNR